MKKNTEMTRFLWFYRPRMLWEESPTEAFLHRLYVKASEKHKGIGTKLLQTAENEMRKQGIAVSLVHLGEPKEQWFESYAFYPKNGYQEYKPRYMRKDL